MQHINLYVNDFTENLGTEGRAAVRRLFELAKERGVLTVREEALFMERGGVQ